MKLKGISDKGLRRIAQMAAFDEREEAADFINTALEAVYMVYALKLSEKGISLIRETLEGLQRFRDNPDTLFED